MRRSARRSSGPAVLKARLAPFVGALAGFPVAAFARGGGGSHSGSHSSSHSGSFGHSGGFHGGFGHYGGYGHAGTAGGFASFFTIFAVILAIAAVIFALWIVLRMLRGGQALMQTAGAQFLQQLESAADARSVAIVDADAVAEHAADAAAALAAMRAADPGFEPETFMQRAEMTFFLVKRAYQHRDLPGAQPYLVPGLFASWSTDVNKLLDEHHRPLLDNLNVRGMHVVDAQHDAQSGDRIDVHYDIVFRGKILDDRDGRVLSDTGDDNRYGERWTFVRGAGVKTVVSGGVVAEVCPSCGAPLALSPDGQCPYCHAQVTTGGFDWSVSAMAPAPFTGLALDPLLDQVQMPADQGLAAVKTADPAFDEAAFIKRVGDAFAALQTAWQARDVDTARGFMSPGLYFSWSAQVEQMVEQHRRNVLEGLRIDRVIPVRVLHGHVFDDITVRIDATCADYEVDEGTGRIVFGDKTPRPFTEYWTFQRAVDAKTGEHALLEKVCPNCGAPLEVTQLGACRYCKAAVTSGRFDWVLSRIEQEEEYAEEFARG